MSKYPEHEKLRAVIYQSQAIGGFLEWLTSEKHMVICEWVNTEDDSMSTRNEELIPAGVPITDWLAEFFDIDLTVLEAEKRAMLDAQRALNVANDTATPDKHDWEPGRTR